METSQTTTGDNRLVRYVTPLTAWALAFGSSVGWGAFVMPGTTFLPVAGPWGAVAGLIVGALVMMVIAVNYSFLMNRHADSGGAFTFVKKILGYDHGFLCAWFLALTYIAILWANATALPLIARSLFGSLFQFGFSYEVAGFQVYMGEIGLAVFALLATAFACMKGRPAGIVQSIMAVALVVGVAVCFVGVAQHHPIDVASMDATPLNGRIAVLGFFNIVALAPWAFVGFESISHSAGEFTFSPKKSLKVMIAALIAAGLAYALLVIMAVSTQPGGYSDWAQYIADLGSLSGMEGLPTFYAVGSSMGTAGLAVIGVAALGAIVTGMVGNFVASSRLLYAMAQDNMMPSWFGKVNSAGAPANAILFALVISVGIPFLGRTAISWIVDVTTIGAAIAYAYTSACAYRAARDEGRRGAIAFGVAGIVVSLLFLTAFLMPNILAITTLSAESYLILATWSILGFAFFRYIFKQDQDRRLGRSTVVWIALFFLILFTSFVWMRQTTTMAADQMEVQLQQNYEYVIALEEQGGDLLEDVDVNADIEQAMDSVKSAVLVHSLVQIALVVVALLFLFSIFSIMQRREKQLGIEKALAEESSRAKTSFLSNMSHEIRTPMNAIIGLDNIALKDPDLSPRTREQLEKIGASAKHLLGLINDILDMSRIESGRMSLKNEEFLFRDFLDQINVMINGQCEDKGLDFVCRIIGQTCDYYVGDDMKLKQVLINILGNAVKFTDPPGTVTFTVEQIAHFAGMCTMRFTISDTGIGMDEEYLPKVFEAFSQEDDGTTNAYGGSGLGMAITKSIVEMMNGQIAVESEKGVGTTFEVTVTLRASSRSVQQGEGHALPDNLLALAVDDDEIACEHAVLVLSDLGIRAERCAGGHDALALVRERYDRGEPYDLVLTDYLMPDMDGIELVREIRRFDGDATALIILTGYSFDEAIDDAWAAGADGLLSKPLFTDSLRREIHTVLDKKGAREPEPAEQPEAQEQAFEEGALAGRRVLLAEDIEINADIMIDLLDMEDIAAEHAENGQVAVDMFDESDQGYYDAVLMDVRMPVMDGLSAASAIRKLDRPDAGTVPIIALTANAFDEDVQRSLQAGMNAHLSKPVEPERLYATLVKLIAERDDKE